MIYITIYSETCLTDHSILFPLGHFSSILQDLGFNDCMKNFEIADFVKKNQRFSA